MVAIIGPAGTGKTTMLSAAVDHLAAQGRPVFGVAPLAAAAEVLAQETGVDADTVDKLILEHSVAWRLPEPRYRLPAGTTVLVDEAQAWSGDGPRPAKRGCASLRSPIG